VVRYARWQGKAAKCDNVAFRERSVEAAQNVIEMPMVLVAKLGGEYPRKMKSPSEVVPV
jgi:hypothetical protein